MSTPPPPEYPSSGTPSGDPKDSSTTAGDSSSTGSSSDPSTPDQSTPDPSTPDQSTTGQSSTGQSPTESNSSFDPYRYGAPDSGASGQQAPQAPPPPAGYGYSGGQGGHGGSGSQPRNGMAIAALILGILALPGAFIIGFPGIVLGVLAIIFAIVGLRRAGKDRVSNKGMAIGGLVTGIIGLIIGVIVAIFFVIALGIANDCADQIGRQPTQSELEQCINDSVRG